MFQHVESQPVLELTRFLSYSVFDNVCSLRCLFYILPFMNSIVTQLNADFPLGDEGWSHDITAGWAVGLFCLPAELSTCLNVKVNLQLGSDTQTLHSSLAVGPEGHLDS